MVWLTRRRSSTFVTSSTAARTARCSAASLMEVTPPEGLSGSVRVSGGEDSRRVCPPASVEPEGVAAADTSYTPPFRFGTQVYHSARIRDRLSDLCGIWAC